MTGTISRTTFAAAMTVVLCLAWGGASPAFAAQRVALVIGNATYAHVPALANPLNDAADIGAALDRLGFAVTRLENAGYAALRRGLLEFQRAASASEIAVVFYAGHGIEVDQRNFLVPVDARLASDQDVEFEAVPLELVSRAVERASGLRLVILDACRENPFAVQMQRAGATRSIGRGLARVEPSGETLVAYAAKEGTVASDGAGRNSPYSEALLGHLEEPGLEVGLMFRKVRDAVVGLTGGRQEPFVYGSLSSRGVYLAAAPAPSAAPAPVAAPGAAQVTAEQLAAERVYWESAKGTTDPTELRGYLERYPGGTFEALASSRLRRLERVSEEPESAAPAVAATEASSASPESARVVAERLAAEREFWASVKESEEPGELQAYLDRYPGGAYAVLARGRLKRLQDAAAQRVEPEAVAEVAASAPSAPASSPPAASVAAPAVPSPEDVESSLGLGRGARRMVQAGLSSLGYEPGPADGLFGARTREAIRRYQGEKRFEATGYLRAEESEALVAVGEEAARVQARAEAERRQREQAARERQEAARERQEAARERQEAARRADDAAYASARSQGTVQAYGAYLEAYPAGRHVADARRLRTEAESRERERREKAPGHRFRDCEGCPDLVVVPSGSFLMGSPPGENLRDDDEGPVHRVTIGEPIAVGVYEVTFGDWDACRRGGGCAHNPADRGWGRGTRPVINVSWEDAREYVGWLSRETGERYRLLSESEWEYVARGGTETRYHWGDAVGDNRANCRACGSRWDNEQTSPVGSFSANAFGVHDVHGNVWEWVEDCEHRHYAGAPTDGSAWTSGGNCSRRVLRGGSWNLIPRHVRSAYRFRNPSGLRTFDVGFRVARTLN